MVGAGGTGGQQVGVVAASRDPQIPSSLARLSGTVDGLASAVDRLSHRLDSVLRPVAPTPARQGAGGGGEVRQTQAPLAEVLGGVCDRLVLLGVTLSEIENRLEL